MGWEEKVPAQPTRQEEIQFIENYKDELISQSYFKWHANEAQRPMKLAHAEKMNTNTLTWYRNFFIGLVISGPLVVFPFARTFFRYNSGVPFFSRPKFVFPDKQQYNQHRNWSILKSAIPLWLGLASAYSYYYTDYSILDDENLELYQSGVDRF